jgi:uncharacterized protein (TIGR02145 family)
MKKIVVFFVAMISWVMVFQTAGIAQQSDMVLSFEGKNAQTGEAVELESVYIKNFSNSSDTTLYGAAPYLYLTWPSSIDELMFNNKSRFSISPNYPNPFSSSTSFELTVLERSSITIKLLDVYGALHATFQQELDWGLHTFEVFTAKNSIFFITADNGITSHSIKLVSIGCTDNPKKTIRYRSIENLKSGSDINVFSFQPGDQLGIKATAIGFDDKSIFHNPTESTSYVFELEQASGEPPIANFTATPTSGIIPLTVNFTDQSTNNPTSWQWHFGDGNSSTTKNPEHTYYNAGSYTVQLWVSNSFGGDHEIKTGYIQVTGSAAIAEFSAYPTSGSAPLTVNFTDQSSSNTISWFWSFGDGNTNNSQQNPVHTYHNSGNYTVQLEVYNGYGTDIETKTNYINVAIGSGTGLACPGTPYVTDIDGNFYNTVLIGEQCWMAENLKTTHYRNGNSITYPGNDNYLWQYDTTGAYAWQVNKIIWKNTYGALYNWYAVNSQNNLCPMGWHVPSDDEWTQLIEYVVSHGFPNSDVTNGTSNALKSCRQQNSPIGDDCNTDLHPRWLSNFTHHGFDEFGFSLLPGGGRLSPGHFYNYGGVGWWWSSTEESSSRAWSYSLFYTNGAVSRSSLGSKADGFSVRCLRD